MTATSPPRTSGVTKRNDAVHTPTRDGARARRTAIIWTLASIVVAWALRAPYLGLPLRLDEGGLALVGRAFVQAGGHANGSMYGGLWIDRPPLLIALYGGAEHLGGAMGVRLLGFVGATATIALVAAIVARIGSLRAVPYACGVAVALTSSPRLSGSFAYPELLASAVTAGVALLVVRQLTSSRVVVTSWLAAGALALMALLLKQSFLDGLAVGFVGACIAARRATWRCTLLPFLAGVGMVAAATAAWTVTIGPGVRPLIYAMFGFRIDAAHALEASPIPMSVRFDHLAAAAVDAALPMLLPCAIVAVVLLVRRRQSGVAVVVATWLGAGIVGVLGGGYYWSHYMLQLVPVLAVLSGVTIQAIGSHRMRAGVVVATLGFLFVVTVPDAIRRGGQLHQVPVTSAAAIVAENRAPSDTMLVTYSRANLAYYTHVRPAFPYQWSLMYSAIPGVEQRLQALLGSPTRPTWIIGWQPARTFGLDRHGTTAALIDSHYHAVGRTCGHDVLIRDDDARVVDPGPTISRAACRS
ncbi:MAG: hypothetical protein H7287_03665 [Thermoleophilia bacterium]|nr:hypothetical protein [Thermoleophilia bacterium]